VRAHHDDDDHRHRPDGFHDGYARSSPVDAVRADSSHSLLLCR
jgi:hypothetical protein